MDYVLELLNNYLALVDEKGGCWILDTGAPGTIANDREVEIAGRRYGASPNMGGATVAVLQKRIDPRVSGLIGLDVLGSRNWIIDVPNRRVTVAERLEMPGTRVVVKVGGFVSMSVVVAGREYPMLFDSGAHLDYFPAAALGGQPNGRVDDFFFLQGEPFQSRTYPVAYTVGGVAIQGAAVGTMADVPQRVARIVQGAGQQGLLGFSLFANKKIGLQFRQKALVVMD